jgi:hypothetical protein
MPRWSPHSEVQRRCRVPASCLETRQQPPVKRPLGHPWAPELLHVGERIGTGVGTEPALTCPNLSPLKEPWGARKSQRGVDTPDVLGPSELSTFLSWVPLVPPIACASNASHAVPAGHWEWWGDRGGLGGTEEQAGSIPGGTSRLRLLVVSDGAHMSLRVEAVSACSPPRDMCLGRSDEWLALVI